MSENYELYGLTQVVITDVVTSKVKKEDGTGFSDEDPTCGRHVKVFDTVNGGNMTFAKENILDEAGNRVFNDEGAFLEERPSKFYVLLPKT